MPEPNDETLETLAGTAPLAKIIGPREIVHHELRSRYIHSILRPKGPVFVGL